MSINSFYSTIQRPSVRVLQFLTALCYAGTLCRAQCSAGYYSTVTGTSFSCCATDRQQALLTNQQRQACATQGRKRLCPHACNSIVNIWCNLYVLCSTETQICLVKDFKSLKRRIFRLNNRIFSAICAVRDTKVLQIGPSSISNHHRKKAGAFRAPGIALTPSATRKSEALPNGTGTGHYKPWIHTL